MINFFKKILGLHIHTWEKWTVTSQGSITQRDRFGDPITTGRFLRQERRCTSCGFVQIKTVTTN